MFLFEEGIQSPIAKSRYDHALLYTKMKIRYNESDMNSDGQCCTVKWVFMMIHLKTTLIGYKVDISPMSHIVGSTFEFIGPVM